MVLSNSNLPDSTGTKSRCGLPDGYLDSRSDLSRKTAPPERERLDGIDLLHGVVRGGPAQRKAGRFFILEHMARASSWLDIEVLMLPSRSQSWIDACNGLISCDQRGKAPVWKRTTLLTSLQMGELFFKQNFDHRHRQVLLFKRQSKAAQVDPRRFRDAVLDSCEHDIKYGQGE